jgi:UDP-N-acetylmuramoyl-L-alanyl-D-glutamate--2,6-diaminopimelate ligase
MKLKHYIRSRIPDSTVNRLHRYEASLASLRYGQPSKKLRIIGVTGTNGKTSVCHYVTQILEEAGKKVGMLTTVATTINGKRQLNTTKMTTLKAGELQRYLAEMVRAGCEYAVVETTSHALDQDRVHGLYYDTVVFTNLTHDHLDYHKTISAYQEAKEKLFANNPRVAVVNADDPAARAFLKYNASQKFTYGILDQPRNKDAMREPDIAANRLKTSTDKTSFQLTTPFGDKEVSIPLPGRFTVSNVLAAVAICLGQAIPFEQVISTLLHLKAVEGRLEPVEMGQSFSVIVDFAHTPDALQQVYETLRPTVKGRLIAVLGATGNRDKTKRPILGALAARYADLVIVTNEDPGAEDQLAIIDEVANGVKRGRPNNNGETKGEGEWWWKVTDRREAIAQALGMAKAGDLVIITGKGGEHVMVIGDKLVPYNDVKVVKEILSKHILTKNKE